jgi:hypothetical protein
MIFMNIQDETLVRLSGEQIILRAAIQWLLAREAKRSGNIDAALREASEAIGKTIAALPASDAIKGPVQEGLDRLIASSKLQSGP